MNYLKKMLTKERSTLKASLHDSIFGFIGGFSAVFILLILSHISSSPWIAAPFGASCVLAFAAPAAPLSQPRNIIGGHVLTTTIGILFRTLFGNSVIVTALCVGTAIGIMVLTKTTHPPAGADPLVVMLNSTPLGWSYIFMPILVGSVVIVILALIINNLSHRRSYPKFWF